MATIKKTARKTTATKKSQSRDWRTALRRHLSKLPDVSAVFVSVGDDVIHVYSVIDDIHKTDYKRLTSLEARVEKAFPKICFEFHGWPHQGRDPVLAGPPNCELVYLR